MSHRTLALLAGAVAVACGMALDPVAGQEPATFRHTTGVSYLHTLNAGVVAEGVTGFRVSQVLGWTPRFALETSVMQLGADDFIFQGAAAGVRWSHYMGPLRVRPAAELVVGRAIVDEGGWWVEGAGGGLTYQPYRRPSATPAVGTGVVGNAEWLHGSGWGADVMVGYWRLFVGQPGGALVVAAGPRRSRRDEVWYWRTSRLDQAPPRLVIVSPDPWPDGTRELGGEGLTILAADRSGIAGLEVDGVPVPLVRAPADSGEVFGYRGAAMTATITPSIHYGRHPLRVDVRDGSGNQASAVVWVTARPHAPPPVAITAPAAGALVHAPLADVTGVALTARSDIRVEVNGCVAPTSPVAVDEASAHAFRLRVPLEQGANEIEVRLTDRLGGRVVVRQEVHRESAPAESSQGLEPSLALRTSRSVSGRALRVRGAASDPEDAGIRDVRVAGESAALAFHTGQRVDTEFLAYAPTVPGEALEVRATTLDGRYATGSATTDRVPAARPSGAALLIGVETYAADRLAGPPGAAATAVALGQVLAERGAAAIPADRLRVLTDGDATASGVREAMHWLARTARGADVVVVYLAGRAVRSAAGEATAFVPHDAVATYGPGSIPWTEFEALLRSLPAEVVLLAELADDDGRASPPPLDPPCGVLALPLPAGGLAVVAATGLADGTFSQRTLDALAGGGTAGTTVLLADLLAELDTGADDEPALRTPSPLFDPTLPLTTVHHER